MSNTDPLPITADNEIDIKNIIDPRKNLFHYIHVAKNSQVTFYSAVDYGKLVFDGESPFGGTAPIELGRGRSAPFKVTAAVTGDEKKTYTFAFMAKKDCNREYEKLRSHQLVVDSTGSNYKELLISMGWKYSGQMVTFGGNCLNCVKPLVRGVAGRFFYERNLREGGMVGFDTYKYNRRTFTDTVKEFSINPFRRFSDGATERRYEVTFKDLGPDSYPISEEYGGLDKILNETGGTDWVVIVVGGTEGPNDGLRKIH